MKCFIQYQYSLKKKILSRKKVIEFHGYNIFTEISIHRPLVKVCVSWLSIIFCFINVKYLCADFNQVESFHRLVQIISKYLTLFE